MRAATVAFRLDAADWITAWSEGRSMNLQEAVDYALQREKDP